MVLTRGMAKEKSIVKIKPKTVSDLFRERNNKIKDGFRFERAKRKKDKSKNERNLSDYHIKLNALFREYLADIEKITGNKICEKQRNLIEHALRNNKYKRISPSENKQHRMEYNLKKRDLIEQWEKNTGKKWGRYKEDIYNKDGKIIRRKNSLYDFHHIILSSYKGDNAWWNGFPAKHPTEHPNPIHRKGGICDKIFK